MGEWVLAEQNHGFIRSKQWQVAVLPFGATEPHNLHLPYGTDTFEVDAIAERACERAYRGGAKVLMLPTIPYGVNTNHLRIPGAVTCSVTPTTLLHLLTDLVDSLEKQGIFKLLLLNGHGGNELKTLTRELHHRTRVFLCVCDWYRIFSDVRPAIFQDPGDHAGEMETSLGLAFFPELVRLEQADEGASRPTRFEAINRGWVNTTRPWHLLTQNTGVGNPAPANADKGRKLMEILEERIASFLIELSAAQMDEEFPF